MRQFPDSREYSLNNVLLGPFKNATFPASTKKGLYSNLDHAGGEQHPLLGRRIAKLKSFGPNGHQYADSLICIYLIRV